MARTVRTDWQAVNGKGVVLYTFNDVAKGRAWVRDNSALHEGLILEVIEVTARRVYSAPAAVRRRNDFSIPAYA